MSTFIISAILALILYFILDKLGIIDSIEEIIFSKFLHYEPIENDDENCYNRDNE